LSIASHDVDVLAKSGRGVFLEEHFGQGGRRTARRSWRSRSGEGTRSGSTWPGS
jgi:hypothetical protein